MKCPALLPCPTCGLPVQSGRGPAKLAWHSCEFVQGRGGAGDPTIDGARAVVLRRLMEMASEGTIRELLEVLEKLRDLERGPDRPKEDSVNGTATVAQDKLKDWVARRE